MAHYNTFINENAFFQTPYKYDKIVTAFDLRACDINFIENWCQQIKEMPKKNNQLCSLPGIKKSLKEVLKICNEIKKMQQFLEDNVAVLSNQEWDAKMELINQWKAEIANMERWNDSEVCDVLKKKLKKRLSKRMRLKRRNSTLKLKRADCALMKERKNEEIDQWLHKMNNEIRVKKKADDLKFVADNVLRDVIRRKADSKRMLSIFDALKKLRDARGKLFQGRGEKLDSGMSENFTNSIDKLEGIWNFALNKYANEEISLRAMLENDICNLPIMPNENVKCKNLVLNSKDIVTMWKKTLFGSSTDMPQREFSGNIDHFIDIRRQWDQFACFNEGGKKLPLGWILPPQQPNFKWKEYLSE